MKPAGDKYHNLPTDHSQSSRV